MYNAYMIRNDGVEIPVKVHPYGNYDSIEETLYASQWFYRNTKNEKTRNLILSLIVSFAHDELGVIDGIKEQLIEWTKTLKYIVLEEDFINSLPNLDDIPATDSNSVNKLVCDELNQEFMRARLGGMVNSFSGSKEMVFRISSVGFNWFNIIYMFVHDHKRDISSVTIAKDEEATGYENYFYKHRGNVFNRMPIDEFLELPGNPIVEELDTYPQKESLAGGKTILESFGNINYERMSDALKLMHYHEVRDKKIWQKQNH